MIDLRVIRLSRSPTNCCSSMMNICGVLRGKEKSNKQQRQRDTLLGEDVEGKSDVAVRLVIFCLSGGPSVRSRVLRFFTFATRNFRLADLSILSIYLINCSSILVDTRKRLFVVILLAPKHPNDDSLHIHNLNTERRHPRVLLY
jgi:hypothetical protein